MQGKILGDYRIVKQMGQGTLGSLLLAEHRFIKKQYVLKVLPTELCQEPGFIQRFEEEVTKLADLDHPHIVKIHNISFAEGLYFLVSDCVVDSIGETTNLAQYMSGRKERFREEELFILLSQIADALDYAHIKRQISHCALKLNNILIGKGTPGIDVFISDFGIAKILSPGKVICRTFLTVAEALGALPVEQGSWERYSSVPIDGDKLSKLSHSFLQNYAFLSPEQKHFEQVGMQADSYAFGVLAYYLITGIFPEGAYEKPSNFAPDYHFGWDALIDACLKVDPTCRPTQLSPFFSRKGALHIEDPIQFNLRSLSDNKKEIGTPTIEQFKEVLRDESIGKEDDLFVKIAAHPHQEEEKQKIFQGMRLTSNDAPIQPVESASLSPIIHRNLDNLSPPLEQPQSEKKVVVETKDVTEATPLPITPPKNEAYAKKLNSMLNRDPIVSQYQPQVKKSKNIEPLQTEMVVIRGGEFYRGSNEGNRDEVPRHMIVINSFALDIHPVTNEQFVRFLDYIGGEKDQNYNDLIRLKDSRLHRISGQLSIESGYSKHPVVGVTWYGALAYANWVGKRLPTEAEWEIAACGGLENTLYPNGANIEKNQANFFNSDTTRVMSYLPNSYGIYDLVGNVYEWCQDWYGYNYYETSEQEPDNPKGPSQGVYRVLRGGCWKSLKEDMRTTHRHRNNPGTVNSTYGFRCAADVQ
ncbi:MAG: bifunctional serine/threonine-protein kinase/formylglycine-generating enzyme family protein [Chlamydiales bacterium]